VSNEHEDNVSEIISDTAKQDSVQASDDTFVEGIVEGIVEVAAEGDLMSDSVSEVLVEEIADLKEQVLRAHAETQNARRRAEQDVEKARKFALEKLVADLLPVADNLERAISAGDSENESQKAVLEGVALTLKSLQDTLKKYKVEMIDPAGEPFDPQLHQAMTMVPNPDVEPNTVLNVFQKGYTLNGRLVRPAMVVVSKAP
jgi:molecular chaperone GrpE